MCNCGNQLPPPYQTPPQEIRQEAGTAGETSTPAVQENTDSSEAEAF